MVERRRLNPIVIATNQLRRLNIPEQFIEKHVTALQTAIKLRAQRKLDRLEAMEYERKRVRY